MNLPGCTTCSTRSRPSRWPRARHRRRGACKRALGGVLRASIAGCSSAATVTTGGRPRDDRRRLRPSPDRDRGDVDALRAGAWPGRRLVLAFQPHRYTRTRDLLDDFATGARVVDALVGHRGLRGRRERRSRARTARICRAVRVRAARSSRCSSRSSTSCRPRSPEILRAGDVMLTMRRGQHRRGGARPAAGARRARAGRGAEMSANGASDSADARRTAAQRADAPAHVMARRRSRGRVLRAARARRAAAFLASLPRGVPLLWLGLGIELARARRRRARRGDRDRRVAARARAARRRPRARGRGRAVRALARQCVRWQLGPAAFFAGIPGSVGGALAMNAGAFGGETWDACRARRDDRPRRQGARARARRVHGRLSQRARPADRVVPRARPSSSHPTRRLGRAQGDARAPQGDAADAAAELRLGVPQSAWRSRGEAHRERRGSRARASAARSSPRSTRISSSTTATRRLQTSSS